MTIVFNLKDLVRKTLIFITNQSYKERSIFHHRLVEYVFISSNSWFLGKLKTVKTTLMILPRSLIRQIEDLDEVRDRAILAQEELANRIAEEMNERSYVFTAVAGIFLPLGFLTGLLGINVGGMPGVEDGAAFWIVVLLCGALGVGLTFLFRLRRWL